MLTSYQPNAASCTVDGNSMLYVINYATGGSFTSPQFDINGDSKLSAADSVTQTIKGVTTIVNPVGMSLGSGYASAPTIRSANFQTASAVKLITQSSGGIKTVVEKGSSKSRTAWWEIRQ